MTWRRDLEEVEEQGECWAQNEPGRAHSVSARALRHACTTAMNEPASPLVMLNQDSKPWADVAEWLLLVHMSPLWDPEGRRERDGLSRLSGFHHRGQITCKW